MASPQAAARLELRLPDPAGAYEGVRLATDANLPGSRNFSRTSSGHWHLDWAVPDRLDRLEYHLDVTVGGHTAKVADPGNPRRAGSAFGDQSVWTRPGYREPRWLGLEAPAGRLRTMRIDAGLRDEIPVAIWSPAGATVRRRLPLLLVHDGPEYAVRAELPLFSAALIASGELPPHRIAMVQPVHRWTWYSAGSGYLRATFASVLPAIRAEVATTSIVSMGASLGGLTAMLLALDRRARDEHVLGAFAQSGSFFTHEASPDEADWRYFGQVSRAVRRVTRGRSTSDLLDLVLTCGALEGNAGNNRDMADALRAIGHSVRHHETGDLHNYTAWRDAFDPHLRELLTRCWE